MIRPVKSEDAVSICAIYNPYVIGKAVTFEEQAVGVETMADRIREITASLPWLVIEEQGAIEAYAYATRWKAARVAYRFSVETTLYVSDQRRGQGRGTRVYQALIERLRELGIHRVIGGVLLPNPGSVALHEKLGFKKVAHFEQVGWKFDQWIDVGYWQLSL